jgi:hypothetical protein
LFLYSNIRFLIKNAKSPDQVNFVIATISPQNRRDALPERLYRTYRMYRALPGVPGGRVDRVFRLRSRLRDALPERLYGVLPGVSIAIITLPKLGRSPLLWQISRRNFAPCIELSFQLSQAKPSCDRHQGQQTQQH